MTNWHNFDEIQPPKSGRYEVEDRKGRVFVTWYEATINGFDMMHGGIGYKIIRWRETEHD